MDEINLLLGNLPNDAALTRFSRAIPDTSEHLLRTIWAPERTINSIKYKSRSTTTSVNVAKFRSYDARTPVGRRAGTALVKEGELPPVGLQLPIGELETILKSLSAGADNSDLIEAIYDDVTNLIQSIRNRMELARGDLMVDGIFSLSLDMDGLDLEADFGLASSHQPTAATLWSDPTATILDDEQAWIQQIDTDLGDAPDKFVTSLKVRNFMLRNEQYRNVYFQRDATNTPTLTPAQMQAVRDQWNLPPITLYQGKVLVDDVVTPVLPDNRVFLYAEDTTADTQYGITAEGLVLASGQNPGIERRDAPGVVVTRKVNDDPVSVWTRATANAMPILHKPENLVSAQVSA